VLVDFLNNKIINQKALGQTCTKTILFISFTVHTAEQCWTRVHCACARVSVTSDQRLDHGRQTLFWQMLFRQTIGN